MGNLFWSKYLLWRYDLPLVNYFLFFLFPMNIVWYIFTVFVCAQLYDQKHVSAGKISMAPESGWHEICEAFENKENMNKSIGYLKVSKDNNNNNSNN